MLLCDWAAMERLEASARGRSAVLALLRGCSDRRADSVRRLVPAAPGAASRAPHAAPFPRPAPVPQEVVVTAADALGAPEAAAGGMGLGSLFQRGGGGGAAGGRADVYALRDRAGVLAQLEAPPLVLHVAESQHRKFPFEAS